MSGRRDPGGEGGDKEGGRTRNGAGITRARDCLPGSPGGREIGRCDPEDPKGKADNRDRSRS
jgi:hypothetical protein